MSSRTALAALLLVGLVACSGGGGDDSDAVDASDETTSSTAPATTQLTLPPDAAPLTGLSQPDAGRRGRAALIVKIDNAPKARPQAGINAADVVVVEKVEDGVTRLAALFHSNDTEVGPVRSARSTDVSIAAALNRPLFAYSGANAKFLDLVRSSPMVDVGVDRFGGPYRRQAGRPAPYNLWSDTAKLYALPEAATAGAPPPPLFAYRAGGAPVANAGATPATTAHIEYLGDHIDTIVDYTWDPSVGGGSWKRIQDGTPFVDAAGAQVTPRNVVIQLVNYIDTGLRDRSNTVVPEAELIGSGDAIVLTDGKAVRGRWVRDKADSVTSFVDSAGAPIALTPGTTWLELAPGGNSARVS